MEQKDNKEIKANKKAKKFNIIDLLFLIVVIAAIGVVAFKTTSLGTIKTPTQKYIVKYYSNDQAQFVLDKLEIGAPLMDDALNVELGKVIDIQYDKSVNYVTTADGQILNVENPDTKSVIIVGEVDATAFPNGIKVKENKYGVGHSMTLRAGFAKLYLRVYDIQLKSESEYK